MYVERRPGVVTVVAAWMLDQVVCSTMGFGEPSVSDTPAGAHASADLYSLLEAAKANNFEPYARLRFVLERLPLATTVDEIEAMLPWNTHDPDLAMNLVASE